MLTINDNKFIHQLLGEERVFDAFCQAATSEEMFEQLVQDKALVVAKSPQGGLLRVLKTATLSATLRGNVNLVDVGAKIPSIGVESIAPKSLFIRDFYEDFLAAVRAQPRTILLGNPGTSKSFFQYCYLWRMLNTKTLGPLPPDYNGNTEPPKVVIRQVGNSTVTVYDTSSGEALDLDMLRGSTYKVLSAFDGPDSLYLFEPGGTVAEPFFEGLVIPTLITVSPNILRYKEFKKNGGKIVYMPVYDLDELLGIGAYLRDNGLVPPGMEAEYTDKEITGRYARYGGAIRLVLPMTAIDIEDNCLEQNEAIRDADFSGLMYGTIRMNRGITSGHVMQYDVERKGATAFRSAGLRFVGDIVVDALVKSEYKATTVNIIAALLHDDQLMSAYMKCGKIMELLFQRYVTTQNGIQWEQREVIEGAKEGPAIEWKPYTLLLNSPQDENIPKYSDMEPEVLYYPREENFPAVKCFYKSRDGMLVAFQITRQRTPEKTLRLLALKLFCDRVGLTPQDAALKLELVLVPRHPEANKANFYYTGVDKLPHLQPARYTILRVHPRYARREGCRETDRWRSGM